MTKKYVISNLGETDARIIKELTEEQYKIFDKICHELNEAGPAYAPYLYISEVQE